MSESILYFLYGIYFPFLVGYMSIKYLDVGLFSSIALSIHWVLGKDIHVLKLTGNILDLLLGWVPLLHFLFSLSENPVICMLESPCLSLNVFNVFLFLVVFHFCLFVCFCLCSVSFFNFIFQAFYWVCLLNLCSHFNLFKVSIWMFPFILALCSCLRDTPSPLILLRQLRIF